MDRVSRQRSFRTDSAKVRRTRSIAAVKMMGEESSISSLGSFPEADMVAQQFAPSKLTRQQTIGVDSPIFGGGHHHHQHHQRDHRRKPVTSRPGGAASSALSGSGATVNTKQCPHCHKEFSNSWAVPKHVQRIHDRAGEFHCPRCLFKTSFHDKLLQHEKDAHRKCPHCRQLYVLLNKHIGTCPKRPR